MTIPIGGVWRPGDSDNEEEDSNFFFGNTKPKAELQTAIESERRYFTHCFAKSV